MKQKKSTLASSYEQAYKEHLRQHKENIERAGFRIIPEKDFNRNDRTQQFYKVFQRQFRNSLMMKHGYKIASLQIEEEDLALYCFSLLQAQANFPIKIFTIDHGAKKHVLDPEQTSRKDMWMETHILVSSLTTSSQDQHKFQTKIYDFFNEYLLKILRDFMKKRINWDYMVSKQYTDQKVITEFQHEIIIPANQKFSKLFD